jgi:predicted TIM-barrel fold metal-dependent hydrolase
MILAFDYHYNSSGQIVRKRSTFYVPNDYVMKLAEKYPQYFIPVISVHPYRTDAIAELEKWARRGVRFIKWLPNAQGMDPSSSKLDKYYEKMVEFNMVLITHGGEEKAVDGEEYQHLGNPLLLRKALDLGVKVVIAHAASLGECRDLDKKEELLVSCFELCWRLFEDKKYEKNLFIDLSAITLFSRVDVLPRLLENGQHHKRFINGSDYPLPAINFLYRTGQLKDKGFITDKEREQLNEIYSYNPLLFDFVLKRTIRHPENGKKFAKEAFLLPTSVFY